MVLNRQDAKAPRINIRRSARVGLFAVATAMALVAAPTAHADGTVARLNPDKQRLENQPVPPLDCSRCDDCHARCDPPPSQMRRLAAIGAAIVPGAIVRGAGSWVVGEKRAAKRVFWANAIGIGMLGTGGLAVGVSGGNEYFLPGVPLMLAGAALVFPTWFSDIAVAAGAHPLGGPQAVAPWTVELGTVVLRDPFRNTGLARVAGSVELGRLGLGGLVLAGAEGDLWQAELGARWRIYGAAATGGAIEDGSRLVMRTTGRVRRDELDEVTLSTLDVELLARVDMDHIDPTFGGTFLEAAAGVGVERVGYPMDRHDTDSLLLGHFAWGVYLGYTGEVTVYYDHRRDSLAGGLPAWRAAGFLGSVGAAAQLRVGARWSVHPELQIGNAWIGTLAIRYSGGSR